MEHEAAEKAVSPPWEDANTRTVGADPWAAPSLVVRGPGAPRAGQTPTENDVERESVGDQQLHGRLVQLEAEVADLRSDLNENLGLLRRVLQRVGAAGAASNETRQDPREAN